MAVLEPVVATLLANTEEFTASLTKTKGEMEAFAVEAKAAGDGAGAGLEGGVKNATTGIKGDLETAGADAGGAFGGGVSKGASEAEGGLSKAEKAARDAGTAAKDSGGKFGTLGLILNHLPGPLGAMKGKTEEVAASMEKAGASGTGMLSVIGSIPNPYIIAGAAVAGVAAISVDFGEKYQSTTDKIAASANISIANAGKISDAFFQTAGTSTYTAQQIADSFSKIAGQAKTLNGGTLTAKQGLDLMKASMDAAEATGGNLDGTTKILTKTLQTFGMQTSDSSKVADILVSAANATGQSVSALGNSLDRTKSRLGGMAPPMGELAGLMVDMTAHGETGRAAMQAMSSSFTQFLKPATEVAKTNKNMNDTLSNLPPNLKNLAKEYENGTMQATQVSAATKGLDIAQTQLWGKFKSAADAARLNSEAYQKLGFNAVGTNGKLLPMQDIIGKLSNQIKGMGTAQAQATLSADGFGSSSAKLVATIQAGPAAYEKYTKQVEQKGVAEASAAKATAGLHASMEKTKAAVEDAVTALGTKLMPIVTKVAQVIAEAAQWIVKHWAEISIPFKIAFDEIKNVFEGSIEVVKGFISFIEGFIDIIKGIFSGNWSEIWEGVKEIFKGVWDAIKGILQGAFAGILGIFEGFGVNILNEMHSAWSAVINFFTGIPKSLIGALENFGTDLTNWIAAAWGKMVSWVTGAVTTYINFWSALPGRVISVIERFASDLVGWISRAFSGLINGVANGIQNTINWFGSLPGRILNAIGDAFNWLRDTGWNIMMGLIHGIENGVGWVIGTIKNVGSSIMGAFKSVLHIFSPSLVFHGYGKNIMEGLALGITDNAKLAQDAIGGVGADLSTNFSLGGISGVGGVGPISATSVGGGQGSAVLHVTSPIQISGQTIAQVVTQYQLQNARATGTVLGQYSGGSQTGAATGINVNAISR